MTRSLRWQQKNKTNCYPWGPIRRGKLSDYTGLRRELYLERSLWRNLWRNCSGRTLTSLRQRRDRSIDTSTCLMIQWKLFLSISVEFWTWLSWARFYPNKRKKKPKLPNFRRPTWSKQAIYGWKRKNVIFSTVKPKQKRGVAILTSSSLNYEHLGKLRWRRQIC